MRTPSASSSRRPRSSFRGVRLLPDPAHPLDGGCADRALDLPVPADREGPAQGRFLHRLGPGRGGLPGPRPGASALRAFRRADAAGAHGAGAGSRATPRPSTSSWRRCTRTARACAGCSRPGRSWTASSSTRRCTASSRRRRPTTFLYDTQEDVRGFVFGGAAPPRALGPGERLNASRASSARSWTGPTTRPIPSTTSWTG
jgi:hypothetical protein